MIVAVKHFASLYVSSVSVGGVSRCFHIFAPGFGVGSLPVPGEFLMRFSKFLTETVCVYNTLIAQLVSSTLDALELKSCSIAEGFHFSGCSSTVCSASTGTPACLSEPSS